MPAREPTSRRLDDLSYLAGRRRCLYTIKNRCEAKDRQIKGKEGGAGKGIPGNRRRRHRRLISRGQAAYGEQWYRPPDLRGVPGCPVVASWTGSSHSSVTGK